MADSNGEYNAGDKLFALLKSCNIKDIIITVTRHYEGRYIGHIRFQHNLNSAKSVLSTMGFLDIVIEDPKPTRVFQSDRVNNISSGTKQTYSYIFA